jgi:hypothetical protein
VRGVALCGEEGTGCFGIIGEKGEAMRVGKTTSPLERHST